MELRSTVTIKLHAAQRYMVWHYLQPYFNNIRVVEFPKSGGTWLSQMLSDLFALPYPRNTSLPVSQCIQHEHYKGPTKYKTIVLVRDGRDVMTSAYFHFLIADQGRPPQLLKKWRTLLAPHDYKDIIGTMPHFIKLLNRHFKIGGQSIGWSSHVLSNDFNDKNILCLKYEDLLDDTEQALKTICDWYNITPQTSYGKIIKRYSFKSQSKRPRGTEDTQSFLRKGISGDWKNYFNVEAIEVFNSLHGDALRDLGYV